MKKITFILLMIPFVNYAQISVRAGLAEPVETVTMSSMPESFSRSGFDTIYSNIVRNLIFQTPLPGCDEVILYSDGASGYAAGTNQFGDLEKMQKFKGSNIIGVYQTLAVFGDKVEANPNTLLYSNIYTVDSVTHGPGELVFTSDPTPMSQIWGNLTNPNFSGFQFPITIPVSDSFFVSFTIPQNTGDSLVCATSKSDCYPGYQIAWERRADSTFKPFNDGTSGTWGLDVELFLCPVLELGNLGSVNQPASLNGITIYSTFPNPAKNQASFKFGIEQSGDVSIVLYDLTGKLVTQFHMGKLMPGTYTGTLPLDQIPAGVYNYAIRNNDRFFFSRIAIQ